MSPSLHDLAAPPPRMNFREELFERAEAAERRDRHRWRATALVAIAGVVAATTAAGVLAVRSTATFTGTYDRTVSCPVPIQGGIPVVRLLAHATYATTVYGQFQRQPAVAALFDASGATLGSISQGRRGYGLSDGACTAAARVSLPRAGLPLYGTFRAGDPGIGGSGSEASCFVGGHVRVRIQAVVRNDVPVSGRLTMWTGGKRLRPVVLVDWAPKRVAVYFSDDCHA